MMKFYYGRLKNKDVKRKTNNIKKQKKSPWELMDPRTKNDSDKTEDMHMSYVGNGYV